MATFSFGGPAPAGAAPAPGAPAPGGGFSFGGAPAPANAAPTGFGAPPAPPPGGGLSFGGAPAAPATAGGFSIAGGAAAPATNPAAPAFGSTPAAPAFGSAPAAPAFGSAPAPPATGGAPASGFAFGGAAAAPNPAAPAQTGALSLAVAPSAPAGGMFGNTPAPGTVGNVNPATTSVLKVPDFNDAFPFFQLPSKIRVLEGKVSTGDQYAGQQLLELMQEKEVLSKPPAPTFSAPNASVRQQLQQNPHVELDQRQAALTPNMLQEVFTIADNLHLSEELAMSLYKEATKSDMREFLKGSTNNVVSSVTNAASELFFLQRSALLKSILLLCQCRLERKLLEATDVLLQKNLIGNLASLIQDLTKLASQLDQPSTQPMPESNKRWLSHLHHERQVATECLFYLAYSTQCTTAEVSALVDLIQSLTNEGLVVLDPVKDVPDAYHPQAQGIQWGVTFTQPLSPLREKNARDWEKELVESVWTKKEPHILLCVSVLTMAVLCGLDTKQELLNRETHDVNQFGVGNALFHSLDAAGSLNEISPIHERLHGDAAVEKWMRKDIWGVLAAAYALSLRPVSAVVASPRAQQASMVKRAWKACLTAPTDHKSFTFVQLSLMPAISNTTKSSDPCDLHEFLLSVLSEFLSTYLDVVCASNTIPPSRSQWYDNETEGLKMKREEQDRAKSFYQSYGNTAIQTQEEIPGEVDLLKRPDCIDDIVAVAIAVCSQGSDYASHFWSREEYRAENGSLQVRPIPSRALKKLELLQGKDTSLIPTYVSFLGALAISEPSAVFELLNATAEERKAMDWMTLFSTLRWYVRKMSDGYAGEVKPSITSSDTAGMSSSSYYYGVDDYGDSSGGSSSMATGGSSQSATNTRLKELGEMNTGIVLSHLAVITKVAANYASGRTLLATMKLSLEDSDEGDSVLVVLFSLAIAPLTPHVRGAVLATIAALLKLDGTNEKEELQIRDMSRKGWDLLELSQTVPVFALDQYQGKEAASLAQAMTFPPSSISAANSGAANSWLPVDPKFGILFEMEHVESRLGCYPATEGLLQLMASLVVAAGCPMDLGQTTEQDKPGRLRPGCTPYIEYVVSFVIPRALGSNKKEDRLPFKSGVESSRLVSRALQVVEAVLARYAVPSGKTNPTFADELKYQEHLLEAATSSLMLPAVTKKLMLPPTEADMLSFLADFDPQKNILPLSENAKATVSLPRSKSPGYLILADLLSSSDSDLLRAVGLILTQDGGCEGMHAIYGLQDFRHRVTWALFGDKVPSVATAKYKQESVRSMPLQSFLKPLLPPIDVASDLRSSTDSIYWRTQSIGSALRILAAASVREQQFLKALSGVTTIVPALQFKAKVNIVEKKDMNLSNIRDALKLYTSQGCLPAVVQCLASMSSDDVEDSAISGTALALLVYCFAKSSASSSLSSLGAQSIPGELRFTRAVAERLTISSKRTEQKADADIARVILTLIQSELSDVLLGFPHTSVDGLDAPGVVSQPFVSNPNECFSVLLDRLRDDEFLTNPSSSDIASTCFEIVYNLTSLNADSHVGRAVVEHLASRLTDADFWNDGIMRFLAVRNTGGSSLLASAIAQGSGSKGVQNVLHGAAYFFNGLATHCAKKFQLYSQDSLSKQNQRLLSSLLDKEYHLLCNAIACLPLDLPLESEGHTLSFPKSLLPLGNVVETCMYQMNGQHDYVGGYLVVDEAALKKKLAKDEITLGGAVAECVKWAETWNEHAKWDSAAAHLSGATMSLTEASLEYSKWTLQSGISNLHHQYSELSLARDTSLLILMDQMIDRLIGQDERVTSMSNRLLKTASINVSTEVLLLVERLLTSTRDRSHLPYFVERIGLATMSSLIRHASSELPGVDDEERSVMLGTAMAQLLDSDSVEISAIQDTVCHVAASFSELCCRSVNVQTSDKAALRRAKISMASRSILSSFIGSLDPVNAEGTNPIVATLATTASHSSTSKTALQALVQVISTLDDNICLLLEKIACSSEGSIYLVNAGVMKALALASDKYGKLQQLQQTSMKDPPSFFSPNLSLLRALLASESLACGKQDALLLETQTLLVSYSTVIERVGDAFPRNGETWLDIVQTMALAMAETRLKKATFGKGKVDGSGLHRGLDRLVGHVVILTANLIEFPLPARYQPMLAPKLQSKAPEPIWWDTVEQQLLVTAAAEDITLPDPPTGLTFSWSTPSHDGAKDKKLLWSPQKYEACFAAAQVVDASLTFLIELTLDNTGCTADIPVESLARGLCRLTDSSRAMLQRLKDIEAFSKGSAMDLGAFDSHSKEAMRLEKSSLEEIAPLFGRCCEKLLILGDRKFQQMRKANEESFRGLQPIASKDMKCFAENILFALQHTRLDTMGVESSIEGLEGSEFSKILAKKMQDGLTKVLK